MGKSTVEVFLFIYFLMEVVVKQKMEILSFKNVQERVLCPWPLPSHYGGCYGVFIHSKQHFGSGAETEIGDINTERVKINKE